MLATPLSLMGAHGLIGDNWSAKSMKRRVIAGLMTGALVAAGLVAPAFGAGDSARRLPSRIAALRFDGIGGFTPASIDPRLSRLVGAASIGTRTLRFTPGEARRVVERVAPAAPQRERAGLVTPGAAIEQAPVGASVRVAPISYNLGKSVSWQKLALPAEAVATRVDVVPLGAQTSFDLALTKNAKRPASRLHSVTEAPAAGARLAGDASGPQLLDVAGAYRLAPNIDLTVGVRYRDDSFRLDRPEAGRRDSQAVYIGTALRF